MIAEQAELSARVYVIEAAHGRREVLYGVSVFAHRLGVNLADVLDRFPGAPTFVEATVGVIRSAGFQVLPTGGSVDHFDIQLIAGVTEDVDPPKSEDLHAAAARLLAVAGERRPNPSYSGGVVEPLEED